MPEEVNIFLSCMLPEQKDLLETIMEEWEKFAANIPESSRL